ncbi:MAG: formylglycine-generating enzyme family protein [Anaerolineae bacterium]|nr:formylglycine-generating enzyme family protein [Anaerolineae bacterium]
MINCSLFELISDVTMTEKSLTLFVNYRRADDKVFVELLRTHFMFRYGQDNVFMDFDTIPPFADFAEFIKDRVRASDVLVMMIGKNWLKLLKDKEAKGEPDYVRMELEEALKHNIPIAPILIQGAQLPDKNDVPASLQPIWSLNIPAINEGRDLLNNIGYIMQGFERAVSEKGKHRKIENNASIQQFNQMPAVADDADLDTALDHFADAVKAKDYPQALVWISYIRNATNHIPPEFELDARERDIQERLRQQQEAKRRRDVCDYQYKFVRRMLKMGDPAEKIKFFVQKIWTIDDGYIPDDLEKQLRPIMGIVPTRKSSLDLVPKSFAWIPIPEGKVTLITEKGWAKNYIPEGQSQIFTVPAFEMAKYPCTNAQFKLFIDAGGYTEKRWWTDDGWAQRQKENWTQPRYWDDSTWNGADYPVVGVSWYEAVAFCLWLSETTGEKITLPTEQQWQRAAQGDKGLMYPWGNEWDASRCNNNVNQKGIGKTTPVTYYEGKGDSPFGLTDMSGNVWEWCLTAYDTGKTDLRGTDVRVLRGGSWINDSADDFRAVTRYRSSPNVWNVNGGFRIVCSR